MFDFFSKTTKAAREIRSLIMYAQMAEGEIKKNHISKAKIIIKTKILKLDEKALKDASPEFKKEIKETIKVWKHILDILNKKTNFLDTLIYIEQIINEEKKIKEKILHQN